jgi:ADP-heptose:LPS heptosyltransferase
MGLRVGRGKHILFANNGANAPAKCLDICMTRQRVLVFHIGSLGDTLVAVPALRAVRDNFPDARITMLSNTQPGRRLVQASDVLDGSGLIDDYIVYPMHNMLATASLLVRLRISRFNAVVYLIRAFSGESRIRRDEVFFRLAGIRRIIGTREFLTLPEKREGRPLPRLPHMGEILLARLAASGLEVPPKNGKADIGIGPRELNKVDQWLAGQPPSGGRPWLGVGIGGKCEVNLWPMERYEELISRLIEIDDVWPVVFGGPENNADAQRLVARWKRGYVASGNLSVRETIAALARCRLFIGNDTGTMHMAAAAGIRCVGIYSSRNYPGVWDPSGDDHVILRTDVPCEGCRLERCLEHHRKCILAISVERALQACLPALRDAARATEGN